MQRLFLVISFVSLAPLCFGQYLISGYVDAPEKNKTIYLSLLEFNEENSINENQILITTNTDSTGYFKFDGKLLSNKNQLYRVHANLGENSKGLHLLNNDGKANFQNFIFSNSDTIVFLKTKDKWFSTYSNTNKVDSQWREFRRIKSKLYSEFSETENMEIRRQSVYKLLNELKNEATNSNYHPLIPMMMVTEFPESILKNDFQVDSEFYQELQNKLNHYYEGQSYALQFNDFIAELSISDTQKELSFYKSMTYVSLSICLILICLVFFLKNQLKKQKRLNFTHDIISLTKQEEKIAELICQDKSNKEIAAELFISLSTVKTHIRNLYAKLEVSNRNELLVKFKNTPRD